MISAEQVLPGDRDSRNCPRLHSLTTPGNERLGKLTLFRAPEDPQAFADEVQHPIFDDSCLGIHFGFLAKVEFQRGVGHFDDEQDIFWPGMCRAVFVGPMADDGHIRKRFREITQPNRILAAHQERWPDTQTEDGIALSDDGGMPVVHAITALPYTETYIFRTVGTGPR